MVVDKEARCIHCNAIRREVEDAAKRSPRARLRIPCIESRHKYPQPLEPKPLVSDNTRRHKSALEAWIGDRRRRGVPIQGIRSDDESFLVEC